MTLQLRMLENLQRKVSLFLFLLYLFIFLLSTSRFLFAQQPVYNNVDSLALKQIAVTQRSNFKNKTTIDRIFAFPGKVIFFPFKIVLLGVKQGIVYVDETKIIPKAHDFLRSDDGKRAATPTYTSRIGVGIKYKQYGLLNPESKLSFLMMFGLYNRQRYAITFERVSLLEKFFFSNYGIRYDKLTTESFYGIGPESEKENKTNYTRERVLLDMALGAQPIRKMTFEIFAGFDLNNVLPGKNSKIPSSTDLYDAYSLPGLETNVKLSKVDFKLGYDSRDRIGDPSSGFEAVTLMSIYNQIGDKQYGFAKYHLDAATYLNVFYNRILMLRLAGEITEPLPNRKVPFYYLSELGEDIGFRGFDRGRFRDYDLVMGTLEFRYPISNNIYAMIFTDAGQVASNIFKELKRDNLQISYGGGFRLLSVFGNVTKLEIAKSKDGILVKFTWN